jgi:hypothetical protein
MGQLRDDRLSKLFVSVGLIFVVWTWISLLTSGMTLSRRSAFLLVMVSVGIGIGAWSTFRQSSDRNADTKLEATRRAGIDPNAASGSVGRQLRRNWAATGAVALFLLILLAGLLLLDVNEAGHLTSASLIFLSLATASAVAGSIWALSRRPK